MKKLLLLTMLLLLAWCGGQNNWKLIIKNGKWTGNVGIKGDLGYKKQYNHYKNISKNNLKLSKTKEKTQLKITNSWDKFINLSWKKQLIKKMDNISVLFNNTTNKICFKNNLYNNKTGNFYTSGNICINKNQLKWKEYNNTLLKNRQLSWMILWNLIDPILFNKWCFIANYNTWETCSVKLLCYFKNKKLEYKSEYIFYDWPRWMWKVNFKFIFNKKLFNYIYSFRFSVWWETYSPIKWLNSLKNIINLHNKLNIKGLIYDFDSIKINVWNNYVSWVYKKTIYDKINIIYDNHNSLKNLLNIAYKKYIQKSLTSNEENIEPYINVIYPKSKTNLPFNIIVKYVINPKYYYMRMWEDYYNYPFVSKSFAQKYNNTNNFKTTYWELEKNWNGMSCNLKKTDFFNCRKINSDYWMCTPDKNNIDCEP